MEDDNMSVGLLIGVNCMKALEPIDVIPSNNNWPLQPKQGLDGEMLALWIVLEVDKEYTVAK